MRTFREKNLKARVAINKHGNDTGLTNEEAE